MVAAVAPTTVTVNTMMGTTTTVNTVTMVIANVDHHPKGLT